ncbi:CotS family spore coat protein [Clostridium fallax]|uniref:Spore coat protein, CotS family n=1 Tax=Clostridium fallax TaxID=1533 RepID=A0A1M4WI07_9CLOT|nr:CotS family spore coat protein [Clostridium fallax]SHE80602.1 spore coat protein, CotS family [Clostridium fallax]SQB05709.1 spore coat protein [Clostridium fallax]
MEDVLYLVENNYNIRILDSKPMKNIYKLRDDKGEEYCLKVIKYNYPHFYFILSAILHLQKRGFQKIPKIMKTINEEYFIRINDKFAYLMPWIDSRESNYDNPIDLYRAAKKLGEFHKFSSNFIINKDMNPRIGWFTWINTFRVRGEEILDFEKRAHQKIFKSDFDKLFLSMIPREINSINKTLENLKNNNYYEVMNKEVTKLNFCHHDYAYHNVLVDKNDEINIIDFDYCILDTHIHDLSSLMIRAMKDGKWDLKKANLIIEGYLKAGWLTNEEIPLMSAFMEFSQGFWQVGLQYYWERQPWEEENFMRRLIKYKEDIEYRQEFVEEFKHFKVVK